MIPSDHIPPKIGANSFSFPFLGEYFGWPNSITSSALVLRRTHSPKTRKSNFLGYEPHYPLKARNSGARPDGVLLRGGPQRRAQDAIMIRERKMRSNHAAHTEDV
jgi:hypothetical protein